MVAAHANLLDQLLNQMKQLDAMVYFMVVVVTVAFGISAMVLVDLIPRRPDTETSMPQVETDESNDEGAKATTTVPDGADAKP